MIRTPNKCMLGSAVAHVGLAAVLFIAPGFVSPKPDDNQVELRLVDVIPSKIIDSAFAGGGGEPKASTAPPPKAPPLQPQVEPPAPKPPEAKTEPPKPEPTKLPEPPKNKPEPKQEPKPEAKAEPEPPKTHKVEVSQQPIKLHKTPDGELATKETKKPATDSTVSKPTARKVEVAKAPVKPSAAEVEAERRAREQARRDREEAERRQQELRNQIASAASTVRSGASSIERRLNGTKIEMPSGPGGEAYINYASVLYSIYKPRWDRGRPDAVVENLVVVKAAVTIARNGNVLSSRIMQPSGMPAVDKAADRVLKSVTFVAPFPASVKDEERTFTINFTVEGRTDL